MDINAVARQTGGWSRRPSVPAGPPTGPGVGEGLDGFRRAVLRDEHVPCGLGRRPGRDPHAAVSRAPCARGRRAARVRVPGTHGGAAGCVRGADAGACGGRHRCPARRRVRGRDHPGAADVVERCDRYAGSVAERRAHHGRRRLPGGAWRRSCSRVLVGPAASTARRARPALGMAGPGRAITEEIDHHVGPRGAGHLLPARLLVGDGLGFPVIGVLHGGRGASCRRSRGGVSAAGVPVALRRAADVGDNTCRADGRVAPQPERSRVRASGVCELRDRVGRGEPAGFLANGRLAKGIRNRRVRAQGGIVAPDPL